MKITVCRDSVCMGDDVFDHTINYEIPENTTYLDVFCDLIRQGYFARVTGNNVVWTMVWNGEDLMSWKTLDSIIFSHIAAEKPIPSPNGNKDKVVFRIRYFSSPAARAKWIAKNFEGREMPKSYRVEYESCRPASLDE